MLSKRYGFFIHRSEESTELSSALVFRAFSGVTNAHVSLGRFDETAGTVAYRWKVDEPGFAMPVRVGAKEQWQIIQPTTEWQSMKTSLAKDQFMVATDLYFIDVNKL